MDRKLAVVDGRAVYVREDKDCKGALKILPDEVPEICRGAVYASRTEMLNHIEKGIEPESMIILRLMERVQAAEEKAGAAERKARAAEEKLVRLDALEARLQSLEKMVEFAEEAEKG